MPEAILTIAGDLDRLDTVASDETVVLLPSSGSISDQVALAVATHRERRGLASRIAVPSRLGRFRDGLDSRLVGARRIGVVDGSTIAARGLLVLDLPASYLPLARRLRLLACHQRLDHVLDAWREMSLAATVLCVAGDLWLETTDPVVAELVALTARDLRHPAPDSLTPWEDELVQAAAQRELGVRIPREIACRVRGDIGRVHHSAFVMALHMRMGVDIPLD